MCAREPRRGRWGRCCCAFVGVRGGVCGGVPGGVRGPVRVGVVGMFVMALI
jgi:hypothetical protein